MILAFDDFELDDERLELRRSGTVLKVEALVVRLLLALARNPQRLLTKEELVDQVWDGRAVADNVITVSMARLRKALGHRQGEREFIATVYGRGYRFVRDVALRPASTLPPALAQGVRDLRPPFVGRDRVLGRLRRALAEAHGGRGRMCALMGEPGIGKTRAAEALERELPGAQTRVAWGYCREAGDTPPLWPWLRLLRDVKAAAWTPELEQRLGPLAAEVRTLLRETPAQNAETMPVVPWGDAARHRSFEAILRTLALASEQAPWVLVLDDLHRADAASIELLSHLLDEIARMRILLIATLRHAPGRRAPRPETHLPHVLGHANCERIALERLTAADVATYVAALVDDPEGSLGRAVFAKSEGNPFFMAELSRQLQDASALEPGALALSDTALDLVRQNVERLDGQTRSALSAAAVIGRSFELSLLAAMTEREPAELMARLDQALAAEVVVAAPDSMTAFAFGHELVRAVLYDALSALEQRRWHLRAALSLEQRANAGEGVAPAELAYHFHAALPESDPRKTIDACRAAAAAAGAMFANSDVVRYLRHALEALDLMERPSVRLRANLLYMAALYGRGDAIEFPRAIYEVMRLARTQGDGRLLLSAACMLDPHPGFAPLPGASDALEHALDLLPDDGINADRAIGLAALAAASPQCYDGARCDALLDEALALARKSGSRLARRVALVMRLHRKGGPADEAEEPAIVAELEQLAQQDARRAPVLPTQLALHRALVELTRGDARATDGALAEATSRARDVRHGELLWHGERFRALGRINAGAWSEGVAQLATLHRRAEQRPIISTEVFCAFDRVVVFGELAQDAELDDAVRSALDFERDGPPSIWSMKVRALATAGLVGEARAALRAVAPADLARLPCDTCYLGTLGHLARAAISLQALDYAEAIYGLLAPYPDRFSGHVSFLCEGSVSQLLGMLSHALGRHAAAVSQLEAGIAADERAGFAPRAAEARLQLARCLLDQDGGDARRARALAGEAQDAATRLGMLRLAREAAAVRGV